MNPTGGVKVVELGTDRRLSLAQNPVVRGNVARALGVVMEEELSGSSIKNKENQYPL